jgi:hypothetical protein
MKKILALTLVLSMFVLAISCSKPKKTIENEVVPVVNAMDLVKIFEEDEAKALSAYKGKIYDIKGVIEEIGSDMLDRPFVTLGQEGGVGLGGGALCKFDKTRSDEISKLNVGETITIRGTIDSFLLKVTVEDCILIK